MFCRFWVGCVAFLVKKMGFGVKKWVFRPALALKIVKNGGFLRVCGCFYGWWGGKI